MQFFSLERKANYLFLKNLETRNFFQKSYRLPVISNGASLIWW